MDDGATGLGGARSNSRVVVDGTRVILGHSIYLAAGQIYVYDSAGNPIARDSSARRSVTAGVWWRRATNAIHSSSDVAFWRADEALGAVIERTDCSKEATHGRPCPGPDQAVMNEDGPVRIETIVEQRLDGQVLFSYSSTYNFRNDQHARSNWMS
jgi:hypothetical protein